MRMKTWVSWYLLQSFSGLISPLCLMEFLMIFFSFPTCHDENSVHFVDGSPSTDTNFCAINKQHLASSVGMVYDSSAKTSVRAPRSICNSFPVGFAIFSFNCYTTLCDVRILCLWSGEDHRRENTVFSIQCQEVYINKVYIA